VRWRSRATWATLGSSAGPVRIRRSSQFGPEAIVRNSYGNMRRALLVFKPVVVARIYGSLLYWLFCELRHADPTNTECLAIETVLGYHGTTQQRADQILSNGFRLSENRSDWLGDGAYFFEGAPRRAANWAARRFPEHETCVIKARIGLDGCLNLGDIPDAELVEQAYERYYSTVGRCTFAQLDQTFIYRRLDCLIINRVCDELEELGRPIRVVRCPFQMGRPMWSDPMNQLAPAFLYSGSHTQVAVRDCELILEMSLLEELDRL
jgi:hypothetical protein